MILCSKARGSLHRYIDGELDSTDQFAIEEHLLECSGCRAEYDSLREVVDTVRGSKPLYQPSEALSINLHKIVGSHRANKRMRRRSRALLFAAAAAIVVLLIGVLPDILTQRFTSFAADAHMRFERGDLPLAVTSTQAAEVSGWLQTQLPFHFPLPDLPSGQGSATGYSLIGARLLKYKGQDIAYLAYGMGKHSVSLLVTSEASVVPAGGETYSSGKLLFHFSSEAGLKLITWRDHDVSYALVSDVQLTGAQSCRVCHESEADRRKFEDLVPVAPVRR